MSFTYNTRCIDKNVPILEELVEKRHELATLLGYKSFSDYILATRMAKNPLNVQNFEQSLISKLMKAGQEEFERLQQLKRDETQNPEAILQPWDGSFYTNVLKEKFYAIDEEKIKEYFPTDHVVNQTLEIYQELLGLKFTEIPNAVVWHEEVTCYEVQDTASGESFG